MMNLRSFEKILYRNHGCDNGNVEMHLTSRTLVFIFFICIIFYPSAIFDKSIIVVIFPWASKVEHIMIMNFLCWVSRGKAHLAWKLGLHESPMNKLSLFEILGALKKNITSLQYNMISRKTRGVQSLHWRAVAKLDFSMVFC